MQSEFNKLTDIKQIMFAENIIKQFNLNDFKIKISEFDESIYIISSKFNDFIIEYCDNYYIIKIDELYYERIMLCFEKYEDMIKTVNVIIDEKLKKIIKKFYSIFIIEAKHKIINFEYLKRSVITDIYIFKNIKEVI
jgi:hypothetical protein